MALVCKPAVVTDSCKAFTGCFNKPDGMLYFEHPHIFPHIQRILSYPVYAGLQFVQSYKDYPGGLFKAKHESIIDYVTWQNAQQKLSGTDKTRVIVDDELPLRGVLRCSCGKYVTGAPSRGKMGKYYYYYKCNNTTHMNLSAIKAHQKLEQVLDLMSLPNSYIQAIRDESQAAIDLRIKNDKALLSEKRKELAQEDAKLLSIEEKYIANTAAVVTIENNPLCIA